MDPDMHRFRFRPFYWRVPLLVFALLCLVAVVMLYTVTVTSSRYNRDVIQLLNAETAEHIGHAIQGTVPENIPEGYLDSIFSTVMVYHPAIEIYLLDHSGNIVGYSAPDSLVIAQKVDIAPITEFLTDIHHVPILGDDPRNPGSKRVFSATEIVVDGAVRGYIYVILMGTNFLKSSNQVLSGYIWGFAGNLILALLVASLAIGYLLFRYMSRNLTRISDAVYQFRNGKLDTRINTNNLGQWEDLATSFNAMAETISINIDKIEAMNSGKKELVANITHDLKTPLVRACYSLRI